MIPLHHPPDLLPDKSYTFLLHVGHHFLSRQAPGKSGPRSFALHVPDPPGVHQDPRAGRQGGQHCAGRYSLLQFHDPPLSTLHSSLLIFREESQICGEYYCTLVTPPCLQLSEEILVTLQVLLVVYLCQRWIVEFKGITEPVLFMIFFSDFVTLQKRTMSKGCWLFTLKMTVQYLRNRDFTFRGFQPNKNINGQYLSLEGKIDKSKTTFLSQTFKVAEFGL